VRAYQVLTQRARLLQLRFNIALFVISLALVGLSVWFALRFADRQAQPLYDLVAAAQRWGRAIMPSASPGAPGRTRSACSTAPSTA
jgi:two-component system nitrogen regulation sensor histidine kinase NtrY